MRVATKKDFKTGQIIIDAKEGYEFKILNKCDDGIWEAKCRSGITCLFESEARFYMVKE